MKPHPAPLPPLPSHIAANGVHRKKKSYLTNQRKRPKIGGGEVNVFLWLSMTRKKLF